MSFFFLALYSSAIEVRLGLAFRWTGRRFVSISHFAPWKLPTWTKAHDVCELELPRCQSWNFLLINQIHPTCRNALVLAGPRVMLWKSLLCVQKKEDSGDSLEIQLKTDLWTISAILFGKESGVTAPDCGKELHQGTLRRSYSWSNSGPDQFRVMEEFPRSKRIYFWRCVVHFGWGYLLVDGKAF